jgi:hypothetical protein
MTMAARNTGATVQSFQVVGLDNGQFAPLFELPDDALLKRGIVRQVATDSRAFPCRVSLQDAPVGDEVLLLSFTHQPADSPYKAAGPIFVRRGIQKRSWSLITFQNLLRGGLPLCEPTMRIT